MALGSGVASAAIPPDPAGGATPVAPHFYNGNVTGIRGSGSDTTFFVMQKISDLFTGAGLYGCTLNVAGSLLFNSSDPTSTSANQQSYCQSGGNVATTDTADNWDRTEVSQGVDDVGSGAGQNQLCGTVNSPLAVDFARSSKPAGTCSSGGGTLVGTGYAKDGVPAVAFTDINPSTIGTAATPYSSVNGGNIGSVASGWLPGDPVNGSADKGSAFTDLSNVGGATSTAFRLWCATDSTRITDWGQLTNLGPNLEVQVHTTSGQPTITVDALSGGGSFPASITAGNVVTDPASAASGTPFASGTTVLSGAGTSTLTLSGNATSTGTFALTFATGAAKLAVGSGVPFGLPVRIVGVNASSGTVFTFAGFAESGTTAAGCASDGNTNAANDPNSGTAAPGNPAHIALENNVSQLSLFATSDFPDDLASQAVEIETSLYFESNGVANTNPYAAAATVGSTQFAASKLTMNTRSATTATLLSNTYPTSRTLFNIYRSDTVKASTGGFLNWICDANTDFQKGLDNSTGINFDTELNTLIGSFGFTRLTDTSSFNSTVPADNIPAPNTTCASGLNGGGTAGNGIPAVTSVVNTQS